MWYIEMGGMIDQENKYFQRKIYTTFDEVDNIKQKFNNTDIYATVFQYNKEDQNKSDLFGPLYLDLDMDITSEEDFQRLKQDLFNIVNYIEIKFKIPYQYIRFYFTGKKGFHLLLSPTIFGIQPDNRLNEYFKLIAEDLNKATMNKVIDTRIYDKKRLFRLSNSINGKTGLYKVPITYENIQSFTLKDMKEYASSPKEVSFISPQRIDRAVKEFEEIKTIVNKPTKKKKVYKITNVDLSKIEFLPCIKNIYKEGVTEGQRNNTTVILASAFFQKGIDFETTMDLMKKWNDEKNSPSLVESELERTVISAYYQYESGRTYGCSSIKDLGYCDNSCKFYK